MAIGKFKHSPNNFNIGALWLTPMSRKEGDLTRKITLYSPQQTPRKTNNKSRQM